MMKNSNNEQNRKENALGRIKKLFQCIWNSGPAIGSGPDRPRSAQDIRDEYLKKCPWRQDGF